MNSVSSFALLVSVSKATDCNAEFPLPVMSQSENIFSTGLFESGSFYYMSGRMTTTGDPFLAKVNTDGSQIDSLVSYQDIFRMDDCQEYQGDIACWASVSSYIGVPIFDIDSLEPIDGFLTDKQFSIKYANYEYPNYLRIDSSENMYAIYPTRNSNDPSWGLVRIDESTKTVAYHVQIDEGGTNSFRYSPQSACITPSNLLIGGMSERADGNIYSSLYGIEMSSGSPNFGLGGDSSSENYSWRDLLCDGEVAYGVISLWFSFVQQHYSNRCQFTKVDTTDATSRASSLEYATLSDNGYENCVLASVDATYVWSVVGIADFRLNSIDDVTDILVLKMAKTDFELEQAFWMQTMEEEEELGIFKVLFDGSTFVLTGYASNFGTYGDRHAYFFGFIHKFSISSDTHSCLELEEITDLSEVDDYPFNSNDVYVTMSDIGLPTIIPATDTPNDENLITEGLDSYTVETASDFQPLDNQKPCPIHAMTLTGTQMTASFNVEEEETLGIQYNRICDSSLTVSFNDALDSGYSWTFDGDMAFKFEATSNEWIGKEIEKSVTFTWTEVPTESITTQFTVFVFLITQDPEFRNNTGQIMEEDRESIIEQDDIETLYYLEKPQNEVLQCCQGTRYSLPQIININQGKEVQEVLQIEELSFISYNEDERYIQFKKEGMKSGVYQFKASIQYVDQSDLAEYQFTVEIIGDKIEEEVEEEEIQYPFIQLSASKLDPDGIIEVKFSPKLDKTPLKDSLQSNLELKINNKSVQQGRFLQEKDFSFTILDSSTSSFSLKVDFQNPESYGIDIIQKDTFQISILNSKSVLGAEIEEKDEQTTGVIQRQKITQKKVEEIAVLLVQVVLSLLLLAFVILAALKGFIQQILNTIVYLQVIWSLSLISMLKFDRNIEYLHSVSNFLTLSFQSSLFGQKEYEDTNMSLQGKRNGTILGQLAIVFFVLLVSVLFSIVFYLIVKIKKRDRNKAKIIIYQVLFLVASFSVFSISLSSFSFIVTRKDQMSTICSYLLLVSQFKLNYFRLFQLYLIIALQRQYF